MKHFLKISEGIDVEPLLAQIDAHPELWGQFGWRKTLWPHREMTDIWVRYNDVRPFQEKGDYRGFNDEHESVWYPAYEVLTALQPIVSDLMRETDGKRLGGVLITRIPPSAGIAPHVDEGWHVETYDKFYLSLRSAPGAKFICHEGGVEVLEPKVGECWRFDNRLPHSVRNDSAEDRVTLIVCIETEKYKHGLDDRRGPGLAVLERHEPIAA